MNTTQCPECRSTDVSGPDNEGLMDCHACAIWWNPTHPKSQPTSPCFGKPCFQGKACYGDCPTD